MDEAKDLSADTSNADAENKDKDGKTFSQEDMDKLAGKIRLEEKQKNEQAVQEAINNAISEYERKAKLTAEEREKEARSKREAELKAREDALSIYINATTKDKLAEVYGEVLEAVQLGAVSEQIKNKNYSGDPESGSVVTGFFYFVVVMFQVSFVVSLICTRKTLLGSLFLLQKE